MHKTLVQYLSVALGGSLGAMARLFVGQLSGRCFGAGFPTGTFIINITGSFILGYFLTLVRGRIIVSDAVVFGVAVGFVGAYTTFSTYIFESNGLIESGAGLKAALNIIGSVIVGLIAVRLGIWLAAR